MRYLLEFIATFLVLWGLHFLIKYFFMKKFNRVTSSIFSFVIVTLLAFLTISYLLQFPYPAAFYLPVLLFFLIIDLRDSMKSS
ncbi:MAG: hypothetical protein PVI40_03555 [Chlamydiota bacterium]